MLDTAAAYSMLRVLHSPYVAQYLVPIQPTTRISTLVLLGYQKVSEKYRNPLAGIPENTRNIRAFDEKVLYSPPQNTLTKRGTQLFADGDVHVLRQMTPNPNLQRMASSLDTSQLSIEFLLCFVSV